MAEEVSLEKLNFLHPAIRPYVKVVLTYEFGNKIYSFTF